MRTIDIDLNALLESETSKLRFTKGEKKTKIRGTRISDNFAPLCRPLEGRTTSFLAPRIQSKRPKIQNALDPTRELNTPHDIWAHYHKLCGIKIGQTIHNTRTRLEDG